MWTHKKANVSRAIEDAVLLTREQIAFVREHLFRADTELVRRACGDEAFRQVDDGPALEDQSHADRERESLERHFGLVFD